MRNRSTLLLLVSLILALITAGMAYVWLSGGGKSAEKAVATTNVIVAKESIPQGTQIKEEMLMLAKKPKAEAAGYLSKKEEIVGKYTRAAILKGEAFPQERLYSKTDELLNMRIEKEHRAVSIVATPFSAVGDLLHTGDRVDVYAILPEKSDGPVMVRPDIVALLVQDAEILSVRKDVETQNIPGQEKAKEQQAAEQSYTVTLSLPYQKVEDVMLAEAVGNVKLALRPYQSKETIQSYGTVWQELLLDQEQQIRQLFPKYPEQKDLKLINSPSVSTPAATTTAPAAATTPSSTVAKPGATTPAATSPSTPAPTTTQKTAPKQSASYVWYTVQKGDTLMSVSRKFFNGSASYYDEIQRYNGLKDQILHPGQKLKIPKLK